MPKPCAATAHMSEQNISAYLVSSNAVFGAKTVPSEEVDAAFGMPIGKLRARAGIVSLAYAEMRESEVSLGARAAEGALQTAGVAASEVDWILATSETHRAIPSLAVAKSFVEARQAGVVLIVTADVHSRTLMAGRVAGEFGGLFGDGASAFV